MVDSINQYVYLIWRNLVILFQIMSELGLKLEGLASFLVHDVFCCFFLWSDLLSGNTAPQRPVAVTVLFPNRWSFSWFKKQRQVIWIHENSLSFLCNGEFLKTQLFLLSWTFQLHLLKSNYYIFYQNIFVEKMQVCICFLMIKVANLHFAFNCTGKTK